MFIAEKYSLQYEVVFVRMWDFKFSVNDKDGLLSEKLTADYKLAEDYLMEFSGLEFFADEETPEDFISRCKKEILKGRYVIIPVFCQDILKKYREVDRKPNTVLMLVDIVRDKFCCVDIHGEVGENGYAIPIRENQKIEYIILPDCPDIHIFNIFVK